MPKVPPKHATATQGKQALHVMEANQLRSRTYDVTWRKLRLQHLTKEPLCRECGAEGKLTEATDVTTSYP